MTVRRDDPAQPAGPVVLRRWVQSDFPLLERLLGDREMTAHLGGPESPEKLRDRHQRYLAADGTSEGVFVIVVGEELTAAGSVAYWESEWEGEPGWEMGWSVLPELQGRGIATAGVGLAIELVRDRAGHRYLHAFPSVDNAASNAICRKTGFEFLGAFDDEYPPGNPVRSNHWRLDLQRS